MDLWTRFRLAAFIGFLILPMHATEGRSAAVKRAVVVGINDYTASRISGATHVAAPPERDWPNLHGAAGDAEMMRELLVLLYGFERRNIVVLTDQQATRAAILGALQQLTDSASKDDTILFYYAGHGSQVRNSASDEPDKLDESLVPADSRTGVPDIRDKELRPLFNRMLDRGARLTVLLDNCFSGSGARGLLTEAQARGVAVDPRDVADGSRSPRPEERGALVLSAAQDFDRAWETRDEDGQMHGAFSWAWFRAMRDAAPGEPVMDTFLRAQARLRADTPFQEPVIAGDDDARLRPFLGTRIDRSGERLMVGVERVRRDGTVVLQGGWANGLSIGSELRSNDARVAITAMRGLSRCEGRVTSGRVSAGALLEVSGWAAPPERPLRTYVPRSSSGDVTSLARSLFAAAKKRHLRWIADPTEATNARVIDAAAGDALATVNAIPQGTPLFVQFPAPFALESTGTAENADYVLVGRFSNGHMSYAWVRPGARASDRSPLPPRTAWLDSPEALRAALLRLRRIYGWQHLESPPESRSPYRLALRRERDQQLTTAGALVGEEKYSLVLRAPSPPSRVPPRYFYVFTVDSHGRSTLLFPRNGSVENHFPLDSSPPREIPLGDAAAFETAPPYGMDTYFLLSTDEPLPNPWILEWDAVRSPPPQPSTPLEQLLLLTASDARSTRLLTPATWSLERVTFQSVPPG